MIIFDGTNHLSSTQSEKELHTFARKLGLKREWYHEACDCPHYDLTTKNAQRRAIEAGAVEINFRIYLKIVWNAKPRWNDPDLRKQIEREFGKNK